MGRVYLPATLEAVFEILSREPSARLFAGGTDLLVRSSAVRRNEGLLVSAEYPNRTVPSGSAPPRRMAHSW
jgi:xanthine dehydrogenase iron-sulfur cluster and FAD-binding subunit A